MKVREYIEIFINKDLLRLCTNPNELEKEATPDDEVTLKIAGKLRTVKLGKISTIGGIGFYPYFSVEVQYPNLTKMWSIENTRTPKQVFYKEDTKVKIEYKGEVLPINLLDWDEDLALSGNKNSVNIKNYKYIKENIGHICSDDMKNYYLSQYEKILEFFVGEVDKDTDEDYIVDISELKFKAFLKSIEVDTYTSAVKSASTFREIFQYFGKSFKISPKDFKIKYTNKQYPSKEEILKYCKELNPRQAFILYAGFLGFVTRNEYNCRFIKIKNINKVYKVVVLELDRGERTSIPVDDEFIRMAEECYEVVGGDLSSRTPYVLRSHDDKPVSESAYASMLKEINLKLFNRPSVLSRTVLRRAGILHRMHELHEKEGIEWTTYTCRQNLIPFKFNPVDMAELYQEVYGEEDF